ncbi:MAG: glycosyltransferase family 2 protein [Actinomycetota bacterium]
MKRKPSRNAPAGRVEPRVFYFPAREDEELKVSIIAPMYNEAENVAEAVKQVAAAMDGYDWEFICVDDGSADDTLKILREEAAKNPRVRALSYGRNCGSGYAIKTGFAAAEGDIIVTVDADLSYDPKFVPPMVDMLIKDPSVDIVMGSPYMEGGGTENVPFFRLLMSRVANLLLGVALPGHLRTVTGMLRAYRKEVIEALELEADGKEIHFEIVSKALAIGYNAAETPAVLRGRERGRSTIKIPMAIYSHLLFSFLEKPSLFFSFVGVVLMTIGVASGVYIVVQWQEGILDPTRPLMYLMMLLLVIGALFLSFGFISSQIVELRREIYRVQKENLELKAMLKDSWRNREDGR